MLDNFNISSNIASPSWIFASNYRNLIKKIKIQLDYFKSKKSFLVEIRNKDKSTYYSPLNLENTNDIFYIDGNFRVRKNIF